MSTGEKPEQIFVETGGNHLQKQIDEESSNLHKKYSFSDDDATYHGSPSFTEHLGDDREYWRDIILGVNDGLVSTFLLIAGVTGGQLTVSNILLTSISGSIAGAVSMAAGEYLATKSQEQVLSAEVELEKKHIAEHPREEILELRDLLPKIGIDDEYLRSQLVDYYSKNPDSLLKIMCAIEFSMVDSSRRNPFIAAGVSGSTFIAGALPSVIPYTFASSSIEGLWLAAVLTALGLLIVGFVKSRVTRSSPVLAGLENLAIAGFGGILAYIVGLGFDELVR